MEDDEKGKLFVGALSWDTTNESMKNYFSRFGKVTDCMVMKNNETGRSRGFGFVKFAEPLHAILVLNNVPHVLDGRTIDPKPSTPRYVQASRNITAYPKVFLGGLPSSTTETDLRTLFKRFGNIVEVVIMYDQEKRRSRGFGFITFDSDSAVERVTKEHFININGKNVEIKKAEPKESNIVKKRNENRHKKTSGGSSATSLQKKKISVSPYMMLRAEGCINASNSLRNYSLAHSGIMRSNGTRTPWGPPPNYSNNQQTQGINSYGEAFGEVKQCPNVFRAPWDSFPSYSNNQPTQGINSYGETSGGVRHWPWIGQNSIENNSDFNIPCNTSSSMIYSQRTQIPSSAVFPSFPSSLSSQSILPRTGLVPYMSTPPININDVNRSEGVNSLRNLDSFNTPFNSETVFNDLGRYNYGNLFAQN